MTPSMHHDTSAGWQRPSGMSLADWMRSRLALREDRHTDWQTFAHQAQKQPEHARAQIRYIAPGNRPGTVTPGNFVFLNVVLPPGHCSPSHRHEDAEEVFFVLEGQVKVVVRSGEETYEKVLGPWDLFSVPPGLYRQEINVGVHDAVMCVVLGTPQPLLPVMQSSEA
ncbi:TPA: cupin domain-containing protein [Pseudomonas aeruginosa]